MNVGVSSQEWREPVREDIEAVASRILGHDFGEMPHPAPENKARDPSGWRWAFDGSELGHYKLLFLHDYWRRLRGDRVMPWAKEVDPIDLKPALGFVMLLDVLDDGFDARYRLYGSAVSEQAGRDWTGVRLSEMNRIIRTDMSLFFRAAYRAVSRRQEPLYTVHASPSWLSTESWRRIILPLTDGSGRVSRFMVGAVPVGTRRFRDEEMKAQRARLYSGDFERG